MTTTKTTKKKPRRDYCDPAGQKLPGVTTVIGDTLGWKTGGLVGWAHKLGKEGRSLRERDEAADLGTLTHEIVGARLGGEPIDVERWTADQIEQATPNAARVADLILSRYDVLHVELAITGARYGGTLDYLLRRREDNQIVIGDLKTSRTAAGASEWIVQLGAYMDLYHQHGDDDARDHEHVDAGVVIHAPYGGTLSEIPISGARLDVGARIFGCLLSIYHDRAALEDE